MECKNARLLLDFACPHADELTPEDSQALEDHLARCNPCAELARSQRRFDHHLGLAMRQVEVPDGLHDRILTRLQREQAASRRWPWYLARGVAAAAVLLVLLWGGWQWHAGRRPAPDVGVVFEHVKHGLPRPDRAGLAETFGRLGFQTRMPDLDYAYLSGYGLEELPGMPGKWVPCLRFSRDAEQAEAGSPHARVYVLSHEEFDLDGLPHRAGFDGQGYRYNLQVRRSPGGRYAYLIFYTGDNFAWLLPDEGRGGRLPAP